MQWSAHSRMASKLLTLELVAPHRGRSVCRQVELLRWSRGAILLCCLLLSVLLLLLFRWLLLIAGLLLIIPRLLLLIPLLLLLLLLLAADLHCRLGSCCRLRCYALGSSLLPLNPPFHQLGSLRGPSSLPGSPLRQCGEVVHVRLRAGN